MSLNPDQVMEAIHFAEFVMAKEKADRIGSTADTVYPMKFFLFHGRNELVALLGAPHLEGGPDDKDVNSLLVRLCALALDAKAILHVSEAWVADRCALCGAAEPRTPDGHCRACGAAATPSSQNPYRQEMLVAILSIKDHEKAFWWTSRFNRDAHRTIVSFSDQQVCSPTQATGRFLQLWALESWMAPHYAVNMPAVLQALGKPVDAKHLEMAQLAEKMAPPNYPFIRLNLADLAAVLRKMSIEGN